MTMAAAIESRTGGAKTWAQASRNASVDIMDDLGHAEAIWRGLEAQLSTPYQRFDFLGHWQLLVGKRDGLKPFIVIAYDSEQRPFLALPLALQRKHGIRTVRFMGGKHATFNMALWDRDFAAAATAADLDALLAAIRERAAADVLALTQQPLRWRDFANPMALLPKQPSVNDCPLLAMTPGDAPAVLISNSFRRRLNGRPQQLQPLSGYPHHVA